MYGMFAVWSLFLLFLLSDLALLALLMSSSFWSENLKGRDYLETDTRGEDGKIIFPYISEVQCEDGVSLVQTVMDTVI
jgi:hypothetical protein